MLLNLHPTQNLELFWIFLERGYGSLSFCSPFWDRSSNFLGLASGG
jgi:hypothetical protein